MLVTGEYEVTELTGQKVDFIVTDTKGHKFVNYEDRDKGPASNIHLTVVLDCVLSIACILSSMH